MGVIEDRSFHVGTCDGDGVRTISDPLWLFFLASGVEYWANWQSDGLMETNGFVEWWAVVRHTKRDEVVGYGVGHCCICP